MKKKIKRILRRFKESLRLDAENRMLSKYKKKFYKYTFVVDDCVSYEQYEASITRVYHTIEKGMAYKNYRAGFGESNVKILMELMKKYSENYDTNAFFYRTGLSVLNAYIRKNAEYGHVDEKLNRRLKSLPGKSNDEGGIIVFKPFSSEEFKTTNFEKMVKNRHSIRNFSKEPIPIETLIEAIKLAQYTPSACNRQGWRTRVVADKKIVGKLLANQNGNRGFTEEIDKVLVVSADLRYFNRDREIHQIFIDGGMYAMRVLDSLDYHHVATIPLSASLNAEQEKNIREVLDMHEAEEFILIIGVGNYPDICQTTRSERKEANVKVY